MIFNGGNARLQSTGYDTMASDERVGNTSPERHSPEWFAQPLEADITRETIALRSSISGDLLELASGVG